ncbi:FtsX-like permease family protein [Oceanobacillus sp. J11TS1]|uniref:ABC transporter permease n=1 Tax=Oceanobacillus sp. J11TS1 TaxID=2807191 RepID=UPI001BB448E9|nr:FtsX-like permease family protein [Oceanobacillus sp. J11TS1]
MKNNLEMLFQFMIVLSFLIILITSLFIISNFELFIYKYKHELAILRSIGGSRWQVFKIIFIQSIIINSIGCILALLFSFFSYRYLQTLIGELFSIEFTTFSFDYKLALLSVGICAVLIQAFMLIPAYRSSKLLPVTAMQENEALTISHVKVRKIAGIAALCISFILLLSGAIVQGLEIFVLIGAGLFLLGVIILIPLYLSSILEAFLGMTKNGVSKVTFIAIKSTIPQIQKSSFIILIISIMMLIVVFGSSFIETIQKNDESYIKKQYETEILVENRLGQETETNSLNLYKDLENVESISSASIMSYQDLAEMEANQMKENISYAFSDFQNLKKQGLLDIDSIQSLDDIVIKKNFADEKNIQVGDKITLSTELDEDAYGNVLYKGNDEVTVGAIVEHFPYPYELYTDILIDWNSGKIDTSQGKFEVVYVKAPDVNEALEDLETLQSIYPELSINSLGHSLNKSKEMAMQRWAIFITVLIVILISVLFGVVNTFINHVNSRRKELAVLRTIYLTRANMVKYIFTQITVYLVTGVILGIIIGVLFTTFISMIDTGFPSFNVSVIIAMALILFIVSYVIILIVSQRISKLTLSEEINKDIT